MASARSLKPGFAGFRPQKPRRPWAEALRGLQAEASRPASLRGLDRGLRGLKGFEASARPQKASGFSEASRPRGLEASQASNRGLEAFEASPGLKTRPRGLSRPQNEASRGLRSHGPRRPRSLMGFRLPRPREPRLAQARSLRGS
jgi:hypothetical protein